VKAKELWREMDRKGIQTDLSGISILPNKMMEGITIWDPFN